MKPFALTALAVVIALAASACGAGRGVETDKAHLHFPSNLPASLDSYIRTYVKSWDGTMSRVSRVSVYGPASRAELVKATSGDYVYISPKEKTMRFYLVVLNGNFVCRNCHGPPTAKPPHGTVATSVWSAQEEGTDGGISNSAGPGVSRLHRLATITVT